MRRHVQNKYAHVVRPAAHYGNMESNLKPSFPNIDRTYHVDKRADPSPLCTNNQCLSYAAAVKSNLAPNYTAIDPCVDFSTYVCEGWRQRNDYRADQACKTLRTLPKVPQN